MPRIRGWAGCGRRTGSAGGRSCSRVGARQEALIALFEEAGLPCMTNKRPALMTDDLLRATLLDEVGAIYVQLGGCLQTPPLNPGPYDMVADSIPVELDEERHFNRYRAVTLQSILYSGISSFPVDDFRQFCASKERECLR